MEYEVLVGDITDLVRSYRSHRKSSIEAAMNCGRLLIQAQRKVEHGDWAGLLEQTSLRPRTAQKWMRLARAGVTPYAVWKLGGLESVGEWLGRMLAIYNRPYSHHYAPGDHDPELDPAGCVFADPDDGDAGCEWHLSLYEHIDQHEPAVMIQYLGGIMNLKADSADVNDDSVERAYANICELAA